MSPQEDSEHELEELLEFIRTSRGVAFSGYKRSSVTRRLRKRMSEAGVATYGQYRDLLEADVDEFNALFDTVLINVTSFFRDKPTWDYLVQAVIPDILSRKAQNDPIRVWSAGCASGEEPYTIAMILAEALGASQLRQMVKIYATDVDNDALAHARQGIYSAKAVTDVPAPWRQRYFEPAGDGFAFRNGLRRALIFGRHDLTKDAPIGRLDLLVCRNTLMYFNADVQARILDRFHFALEDDGYLFLGRAEMLLAHGRLFTPVNMKNRVFQKSGVTAPRVPPMVEVGAQGTRDLSVRELLVDVAPGALLGVDAQGTLILANAEARATFGIGVNDLGKPLHDLEISYRPVELRSRLEQAYEGRRPVRMPAVERRLPDGGIQYFDVNVTPLVDLEDTVAGAAISFVDVSGPQRLRDELQRSREDLETAYEELRSTNEELETTNEELQSSNEELETTNEELQSTNEELETTNEELQSSNEELETMNEELQSTNEELETTNEELRTRSSEILSLNERLEVLLSSLSSAVIAVDRELLVELWNDKAEDLWGLRQDEVQRKPFAALDFGLPVATLLPVIRDCLDARTKRETLDVESTTRTGKPVRCTVTCTPLAGPGPVSGVVLVVDVLGD